MGSLLGFLAEQQVSHDDPSHVNNAVEVLTGIDTTLRDSPDEGRKDVWQVTEAMYDKFEVGDYVTRNN